MRMTSAIAVGLLALAVPARAQTTDIYRSGLWSAYSGTAEDQRRLCGVASAGAEGRRVAVQQYPGVNGLEVQLRKDSWSIPDNTAVTVEFRFDSRETFPGQMTGTGNTVAMQMGFEQSAAFMRSLRNGRVVQVFFPDGSEPMWSGGLSGSGNAINAFNDCRMQLEAGPPTQPYATSQAPALTPTPTQPFGGPAPQPPQRPTY